MTPKDYEDKLAKDFPLLYVDMHGDPMVTCLSRGVETGPGWYDIIYNLSEKLQQLIATLPEDYRKGQKITQVKQKFGGLRVYMHKYMPEVYGLIEEAEKLAYKTCEQCGKPGQLCGDWKKNEWLYTSCKEHAKKEHKGNFNE